MSEPSRKVSLYQLHKEQWKDCTRCPLSETRSNVVLARGSVPCDVLFVGEAPGKSEDILGQPFVGAAGHLLDEIIERSIAGRVKYALTNLVCCLPIGDDGEKISEPDPADIAACSGRLEEFVNITQPGLIICVGKLSENWIIGSKGKKHVLKDYECERISVTHPAAILRANLSMRSLMIQRCIITIRNAVDELIERKEKANGA